MPGCGRRSGCRRARQGLKRWHGPEREKPIFSNAPMALAWHLGLGAHPNPSRKPCASASGERARECFLETADPRFFDALLVYFEAQRYPYHYSLDELAVLVELTPVEVTSDGGVYEVSRREPDD